MKNQNYYFISLKFEDNKEIYLNAYEFEYIDECVYFNYLTDITQFVKIKTKKEVINVCNSLKSINKEGFTSIRVYYYEYKKLEAKLIKIYCMYIPTNWNF